MAAISINPLKYAMTLFFNSGCISCRLRFTLRAEHFACRGTPELPKAVLRLNYTSGPEKAEAICRKCAAGETTRSRHRTVGCPRVFHCIFNVVTKTGLTGQLPFIPFPAYILVIYRRHREPGGG